MKEIIEKSIRPKKNKITHIMISTSIASLFIFISFITDQNIINAMNKIEYTLPIWMIALSCILSIFSFIYYNYLYTYMIDEKMKDYGILASLGYKKIDIQKSFLWIIAKSIATLLLYGLLSGTIIYYSILIILNRILDTTFEFHPVQSYILVSIVYSVIYALNAVSLGKRIRNTEISDMISFKKKDKSVTNPRRYQIVGVTLLAGGLCLPLLTGRQASYGFASALFPMLCLIASAYCLIMSFSYWFTKLFARSVARYHRNLFFISQLRTNYKKYAKLLTACTIIVIFGLYMIIMNMRLTASSDDHSFEMPYDFIVSLDEMNDSILSNIKNFESQHSEMLSETHFVELSDGTIQWDNQDYVLPVHVMPERSYRILTGKNLIVQNGQIVVLSQIDRNYYDISIQRDNDIEWGFKPPGPASFRISDTVYHGTIVKEIWEILYNLEIQNQRSYIISDHDYETIAKDSGYTHYKYFVRISDQKYTKIIYNTIQAFGFKTDSKEKTLSDRSENKFLVSIIISLTILFIFSSLAILIILRISQNLVEEKNKYLNLFSIGITYQQLKSEIQKEMAVLFFLPVVFGSAISILYTLLSTAMADINLVFISFSSALLLFLVEFVLFQITTRTLSRQYLR